MNAAICRTDITLGRTERQWKIAVTKILAPDSYAQFLADLKSRIQAAQFRAALAVNRELVLLYWQIGRDILDRQLRESWGAKVIDRLAADLKRAFPDMKGFSPRNLKYMRAFAEAWPEETFVQAVLAQITWYHNVEFFIDLPFYHLKLRAYIVVDLKMRAFEPEFAGKMNFYLSAVDDLLRHPDDEPSIGIVLCKTRGRVVAEYALRDINKPIGISEYRLAESLPETLQGSLPTIEELENELGAGSERESQ